MRHMLAAFQVATHSAVRHPVMQIARAIRATRPSDIDIVEDTKALPHADWYTFLANYSLVLCPRGNGVDTHRAWETLYVGRIPVVLSSAMDAAFSGLPVMILKSWDDLKNESHITDFESTILAGMSAGAYDTRRLWLSYFVCRIMAAAGRVTPGAISMGITCRSNGSIAEKSGAHG